MPFTDPEPVASVPAAFVRLVGSRAWSRRLADISRRTQSGPLSGRAAQQRHALEIALGRVADQAALAKASPAERRVLGFAAEAVRLARSLPEGPRTRLRGLLQEGLTGEATLIPLFHLLRTAARIARAASRWLHGPGRGTPFDLTHRSRRHRRRGGLRDRLGRGRPPRASRRLVRAGGPRASRAADLARRASRPLPAEDDAARGAGGPDKALALQERISELLAAEKRQDRRGCGAEARSAGAGGAQARPCPAPPCRSGCARSSGRRRIWPSPPSPGRQRLRHGGAGGAGERDRRAAVPAAWRLAARTRLSGSGRASSRCSSMTSTAPNGGPCASPGTRRRGAPLPHRARRPRASSPPPAPRASKCSGGAARRGGGGRAALPQSLPPGLPPAGARTGGDLVGLIPRARRQRLRAAGRVVTQGAPPPTHAAWASRHAPGLRLAPPRIAARGTSRPHAVLPEEGRAFMPEESYRQAEDLT
jgi:hypothetical protein